MVKISIYTTNACPYCDAAKALLRRKNFEFSEIHLSRSHEDRQLLVQITGNQSFPQIIIDGQFIGGFDELRRFDFTTLV
jgi:glutaredoxin 3